MRRLAALFTFWVIGVAVASAQVTSVTEEHLNRPKTTGSVIAIPNTPQGEEFGTMPWIVRNGNTFTTSYLFKDRNQFNGIDLDTLAFYGQREDGVWTRYFVQQFPACTHHIDTDMLFYHVGFALGPDFDGYPIGSRIRFGWRIVFRNVGCSTSVTKVQKFELIKGEPLPLYPGQYPASLHNHSVYTDNVGEFGGSKQNIPDFWAVGGRIYLWTDHGYDFTAAECTQMATDATNLSNSNIMVLPGSEGNIDNDNDNDFPDTFLHTLTNLCLRTPWEFPGDNSSSVLWTEAQFQTQVAAGNGYWAAAHPFTTFTIPGTDGTLGQWSPSNIALAMADNRFLGWQIWNRPRSSTSHLAGNLNTINPYPWVPDPAARNNLEFGLSEVDAIQQAHLMPLRRANLLAGTDDHWDRAYSLFLNSNGQVEVNNSALGKCFTIPEMSAFTAGAFWEALVQGRQYLSNGPGCRFGIDLDNDGDLETTYGEYRQTPTGTVRVFAQSNNEFGLINKVRIYRLTPTSRDSTDYIVNGISIQVNVPVASFGTSAVAIRARVETVGGYGDDKGLVLTNWIYLNTTPTDVSESLPPGSFLAAQPNPSRGSVAIRFAIPNQEETSIDLYDVAGRRVETVWRGQTQGQHTLTWLPRQLPAGIYLIRLTTPSATRQQKIVLLP